MGSHGPAWIISTWIASLAAHLGYDYVVDGKGPQAGLGTASLTLYFAVTYAIQRLILQGKAQRIAGTPQQDTSEAGTHVSSW